MECPAAAVSFDESMMHLMRRAGGGLAPYKRVPPHRKQSPPTPRQDPRGGGVNLSIRVRGRPDRRGGVLPPTVTTDQHAMLHGAGQVENVFAHPGCTRQPDHDQRAPRGREIGASLQRLGGIAEVMQRGHRRDHIKGRTLERVTHHITADPPDSRRRPIPGFVEHSPIDVDCRHRLDDLSEIGRKQPVAGPHIKAAASAGRHLVEDDAVIVDVVVPPRALFFRHAATVRLRTAARR